MIKYPKEMKLFICENYPSIKNNDEFAKLFNARFNTQCTANTLNVKANSLGVYKFGNRYTPEMLNFLKENCNKSTRKELADELNKHFGVKKTARQIKDICLMRGYSNKENKKYSKEMEIFIREKYPYIENNDEFVCIFNAKFSTKFTNQSLQFKAHQLGVYKCGHKRCGIGDEYICYGVTYIKGKNKKWTTKKEYVYEQNYSKICSNEGIIFIDGNCQNFSPENLLKLNRKEIRMMAKFDFLKKDTQTTMLGLSLVRLKIMADQLEGQRKPKKRGNQCKLYSVPFFFGRYYFRHPHKPLTSRSLTRPMPRSLPSQPLSPSPKP